MKKKRMRETIDMKVRLVFLSVFFVLLFVSSGLYGAPNWTNEGAFQRDNGLRGELILNGSWRWQPWQEGSSAPQADAWLLRNVPGNDKQFFIRDGSGKVVKEWKGKGITGVERCWQEREFTIPAAWKGRKVVLEFYSILGKTEVYLDDQKLGDLSQYECAQFQLPEPVRFHGAYKLTVLTDAIYDDVWLRSCPAAERIEDHYLTTSFRSKQLRIRASGSLANAAQKDARVRVTVAEKEGLESPVKQFEAAANADEKGAWSVDASNGWENPRPWSIEHPNLYWFKVELLDGSGKALDATLAERFGFREFWINGGDFYLNDKPFHAYSDMIPAFKFNRLAAKTSRFVLENVRRWKELGLNACMMWGFGETSGKVVFDVLDEVGYVTWTSAPDYGDYVEKPEDLQKKGPWEKRLTSVIKRYRHHPSLVMWDEGGGSQIWDYCPGTLDGSRDPAVDWPAEMKGIIARYLRVAELFNRVDGTRPVIWHSSVAKPTPIVCTMGYLGFDMDLQERENWPLAWSKVRHKPLFNMEFGMPFERNWVTRDTRGSAKDPKPLFLEYSAMYFGDAFYRTESVEALPRLSGEKSPYYKMSLSFEQTKALFTKRTIQAWRTYGVNMGPWGEQRLWYEPDSVYRYESKGEDPRRPGATPDEYKQIDEVVGDKLNPIGEAGKEALTPLYVFIGGDAHFTRKDHAFESGEEVLKHAVVVNDLEEPVTLSGKWQLVDDARVAADDWSDVVLQGDLKSVTVQPGRRALNDLVVSFKAPPVDKRKAFTLKVSMTADHEGWLADQFSIEVFPVHKGPVAAAATILCFDPVGDTEILLNAAGLKFQKVQDLSQAKPGDLLVIGRHCLEKKEHRDMLTGGLDAAVADGLRVIVFEQAANNVLGLNLEETSPRHTFIRAPGHPVFRGLEEADFVYWRGESDLIKAYADPLDPYGGKAPRARGGEEGYPLRLWHWGNDNNVATYVIKKPQVGASRPLVDCGFDLLETPLLETARGKGRIVFCQLDVTNRYGRDPAATRLVDNLFAYLSSAKTPNDKLEDPIHLSREKPSGVMLVEFKGYRAKLPEGPLSWGINAADLFFRQELTLPGVKSAQGDAVLFAWVKDAAGSTIGPESMKTGWQKSKAMRIIAALRVNQGGSSDAGPMMKLQGDSKSLYPVEWREGFVDPYDHWRW